VTKVDPSEGPADGKIENTMGAAKNTKDGPASENSAPLFETRTSTVPSFTAGVTQVAEVEERTEAGVINCPNLHVISARKLTPMRVITDPPLLTPILGVTAVTSAAAMYSKEVDTERSAPLFNTSSATTAGEEAEGEMQMTVLSDTNIADGAKLEPNLHRSALGKISRNKPFE
jgi:hypothetical protein